MIVALGFLVIVHEFGHYFFARLFGIRVSRFYLFFNPWFSILKYHPADNRVELIAWTKKVKNESGQEVEQPRALLSFKVGKPHSDENSKGRPNWRATLYGIGWVPLGGYCDIAGMVDETKTAADLPEGPQPWEFRSKPSWQRLLVMLGGVMFNFLLAIFIYAGMAFYWGDDYLEYRDAYAGMQYSPAALAAGFQHGDIPLAADGVALSAADGDSRLSLLSAKTVTVLRDGKEVTIDMPGDFPEKILADNEFFMSFLQPVVVDSVLPGSAAAKAGMMAGDSIAAIGEASTVYYYSGPQGAYFMGADGHPVLAEADKNTTVDFTVVRDGKELTLPVAVDENNKVGIGLRSYIDIFKYPLTHVDYGFFESFPTGVSKGTGMLVSYVSQFKYVFTKEGAKSLGGFGAIGNMFPNRWNWYSFWTICAFLSVALAFMNVLPIPALDGGHVLFLIFEMVTGRKMPEKVLGIAQMVGMGFLLILLLYANGMDIFRAFFK